ncbi:DUF2922 domain-containing protein [Haloimpatiens lingqiaonensis]|uniref:DUF2922 domain-containing protein n=1 Tax=Haloimpatiens lingqiaonensis TaxID=1380675 RepID=UPI0010FE6CEC|nr:DUF2922 domain-containing protein [Haloimpatiens lingqiaonensis]
MSKDLVMYFMDQDRKKVSLRLKDVKADITQVEVEELMDLIMQKNIFKLSAADIVTKDRAEIISSSVEQFKF